MPVYGLMALSVAAQLHDWKSRDAASIENAAVQAIQQGKAGDLAPLLADPQFLDRLDVTSDPQRRTAHLSAVFAALSAHPSKATEALCLRVAQSPEFRSLPARMNLLLPALASVRPMGDAAAALFREANTQGFFALNAPLLARNGSKTAMAVFAQMLLDESVPLESRIDAIRQSIPPVRNRVSTVNAVDHVRAQRNVSNEIIAALADTLFDYRPAEWYGKTGHPPTAAPWESASPEAKRAAVGLAKSLEAQRELPPNARKAAGAFAKWLGGERN